MNKKTNPRKIPVTWADLKRAKQSATEQATSRAFAIFFTVLADKEGYTQDDIIRVWGHVDSMCDSVKAGYVNVADMLCTLKEEYGIALVD